jgi:hypothetical protein
MFFNQKMDYGTKIENIDEVLSKTMRKRGVLQLALQLNF